MVGSGALHASIQNMLNDATAARTIVIGDRDNAKNNDKTKLRRLGIKIDFILQLVEELYDEANNLR